MIDRRAFLIRTGWLAAGTTVLTSCSSFLPALPSTTDPEAEDGLAWIQIQPDGRVRFYCPRMEMGQGAPLGLSQIVAEQLHIGPTDIDCVTPTTDQVPSFKMTVGSEGIRQFHGPLSQAAAHLRASLRNRAAEQHGLASHQLGDADNGFRLPDGSHLPYSEIVGEASFSVMDAPPEPAPRPVIDGNAVGQSWRSPDLDAIVTGRMVYSRDVVAPGMLYGDVLRPPGYGAELVRVDGKRAETLPGVVAVVVDLDDNFAGVVADSPFALEAAVEAMKAEWTVPETRDLESALDVSSAWKTDDFEHEIVSDGSLQNGKAGAVRHLRGRYDTPFAAHAAMEARAAVARVRDDTAEIWCGSQDPYFVRGRVARRLGRDEDTIVVHPHRMGGGFGGRVPCQASEEAAVLSAAVGKPVRVQWRRETEFRHNYFQPAFSHAIAAGVDEAGRIAYWDHGFVSAPIIFGLVPKPLSTILDLFVADDGTARGAVPPYAIANRRIRYSDVRTEIPTGSWRGLGSAPNTFAIESMMDELAATAGTDPLAFRLDNLPAGDTRMAAALQKAATMADWTESHGPGSGLGIAGAIYKGETYVAVVAKVTVDSAAQTIRVDHIWCAQDCGLMVNPDQVENQIAGNIAWGCSMALKERMEFAGGTAAAGNFDGYAVLRHDEAPEVTIALIDPTGAAPSGVGESAFGPVAAAIANAVFNATGQRLRRLPLAIEDTVAESAA